MMMDGRFDQHFLEIFAHDETTSPDQDRLNWAAAAMTAVLAVAVGVALILIG